MSPTELRRSGMQGVGLVAVTYVYFLIFAQFAFIHRLDALGITGSHLKSVMAAMAWGGIVLSLVAPRVQRFASPAHRLQCAFGAAAIAAFLTIAPLNFASAIAVSTLIGAALGLLTVTLVTHLRKWIGERNALLKVGLGTGIGYFLCNVPLLFTARAQMQAGAAGVFCLLGMILANIELELASESPTEKSSASAIPFPLVVASFAALVWLDSAAFFIIQSTSVLKAGTWQGSVHLWANAVIHLSAALLSAWLLLRRELPIVLAVAVGLLGFACMLLLDPARAITASVLYPAGVSLYSVALVAYPSLLSHAASSAERGRQAGWIYAIAGWIGSALGIGMGQNLGHVPPAFVAVAAMVVFTPVIFKIVRRRPRELALTAVVLFVALVVYRVMPAAAPVAASTSAIERGRQVYISEGCIHCHSQYVRPGTADVLMWGPVESLDKIHAQRPPLIGNRRQGPDLSQVGVRRSALWLKMHLYNPREVSGESIMPSFAFLFRDGRGNDLVAYLASLHSAETQQHSADEKEWHLSADALASADTAEGPRLYDRYCATCHNADGKTRLKWQSEFIESPAVMNSGLKLASASKAQPAQVDHFAQIIKFGVPKSDMAGHEYMPDKDVASLSLWLAQSVTQPSTEQTSHSTSGDEH